MAAFPTNSNTAGPRFEPRASAFGVERAIHYTTAPSLLSYGLEISTGCSQFCNFGLLSVKGDYVNARLLLC